MLDYLIAAIQLQVKSVKKFTSNTVPKRKDTRRYLIYYISFLRFVEVVPFLRREWFPVDPSVTELVAGPLLNFITFKSEGYWSDQVF